ncbi:hypothetical protein B5M09_003287 [Aphanomyces astaci]|uniref:Uncharacterized protein n=1 Tax=Aphanomyces astaci TaxID=112090 RepID=A0A3R8DAS6_APHAT|nr:hypothetical protein B5M09_003287 [Aphanomyces astaci]
MCKPIISHKSTLLSGNEMSTSKDVGAAATAASSKGKLSGLFQKNAADKKPEVTSTFQFGFQAETPVAAPGENNTVEPSKSKKSKKKKTKAGQGAAATPAIAEGVVTHAPPGSSSPAAIEARVHADQHVAVAAVTDAVASVSIDESNAKKKKKKKKKSKAKSKSAVSDAPTEFEFLFTFDKPGFSESELAAMALASGKKSKPNKSQAKKKQVSTSKEQPSPVEVSPPSTNSTYVTLRKAPDNSSEVQKMQLRYTHIQ